MVFNSFDFAVFLCLVWAMYALMRGAGARRVMLLIMSLVFYGWWDWRFLPLIIGVSTTAWAAARLHQWALDQGKPRAAVWAVRVGVGLPLLVLGFFKYALFMLDSSVPVLAVLGLRLPSPELSILLPVGISFYTFQALSYVIDVSRGRCAVERSFWKVLLYITFFPQLVAGPIVTAASFMPQLHTPRMVTPALFASGLRLVLWGLLLKVVFADALATWADPIFAQPGGYTLAGRWLGVLAFSGQIYFDFAGYSTMAIGLGRTLGYSFPLNFDVPYLARNITDFWRRWHISLSNWLRDYLFIPLGGNRQHFYRNLLFTMVLGGLWHGASWNFILWGLLHGIALIAHKLWIKRSIQGQASPAGHTLSCLLTQAVVLVAWVPFRAADLKTTLWFFTPNARPEALTVPDCQITIAWLIVPLIVDGLLSRRITAEEAPSPNTNTAPADQRPAVLTALAYAALLLLILALGTWESQTFLYFQF